MIELTTTILAQKDHVASDLGGEIVILDLESGTYYGLNEVGKAIWDLVQKQVTVAEIRDNLLQEYDVESDRCEREVVALLEQMAAQGLIEIR